mmetsp:Transcript_23905/g.73624  ORF Transcript_23905/g.73624 Transcript_23905/m.73624 type:complete len:175 (-) Transcript_23905:241-765(-)
MEDVVALRDVMRHSADGRSALEAFSRQRQPEARALVQISRGLDRPGLVGYVTFVLPLLLDLLFHRLFPRVFATNAIAAMQQQQTFVQVQRRKRRDRLLQLTVLAGLAAVSLRLAHKAVTSVAVRLPPGVAWVACDAAFALALDAAFFRRSRSQSPADVLARRDRLSNNETFLFR